MAKNSNLAEAKRKKNDEFYTRLPDIENELHHYKPHFKGKVVYCNCDDPSTSAFWKFFTMNFQDWGLKKLIATHYEKDEKNYSYKIEMKPGDKWNDEPEKIPLPCNGDFRSAACIELLKEGDIVVTNPPFSLFREYVAQLMEYEKKFVIIGNMNAITYKEIFPLLKENKLWTGFKKFGGGMDMIYPSKYFDEKQVKKYRIDNEGNHIVNVMGVIWFTNLEHKKRHEFLDLRGNYYDPEVNPKYDNYDAIEVKKVNDIPCDYDGAMGVPITFLDKYCPEQFEIIGSFNNSNIEKKTEDYYVLSKNTPTMINGQEKLWNGPVVSKKPLYKRIVIRRK